MACALSSITFKLCLAAISIISSIGAVCPKRCTGTMAFVLGVMALATAAGSIIKVSGNTSTKTGVNPNKAMTSTVAAKVKSAVITSSPGCKPRPIMAICSASVPLAQGMTCFTPR